VGEHPADAIGGVQADGGADREPDYRFSLANERTFLAWIRTSLGLLAGGVAVRQLGPGQTGGELARSSLAGLCVLLGGCLAAGAFLRHRRVQEAMRAGVPLPGSALVPLLTVGVGVTALLCALLVALG
jgi:inner membrane protein YidH